MLKEHLTKYSKEIYPMHMPGHKGGRMRLIEDFYKVDVTEVPDTDHLYKPEGILAESLEKLSEFYGTDRSLYLVNGSTVGLLSAIGGLHEQGDEILVARNCHHSVYNALSLFRLKAKYIFPRMTKWGLIGGIHPEDVKKILASNPKIVSFVMTSPTYEGFLSDIGTISAICKRYNVTLIVDEAHGAHLPYSHLLPKSAIEQGAEVVIHSVHKTLPAITGAGLMHLNLPEDQKDQVLELYGRLQTSSPSYIMMANVDACVAQLGYDENLWPQLLKNIETMNTKLKKMKKLYCLTDYSCEEEGVYASDPFKSLILTLDTRETGKDLEARLYQDHKIQMELSDTIHTLGILSPADDKKALGRYAKALISCDRKMKKALGEEQTYRMPKQKENDFYIWEAEEKEKQKVSLEASVGRISGDMIIPYPPGIPAVVPGERIMPETVAYIRECLDSDIDVLGITDGCLRVIDKD